MTLERKTRLGPGEKSLGRGSTFEKPRSELARRPAAKKPRRGISPASDAQRSAIRERPFCVACGVDASEYVAIDPAHLCPRSRGGCDDELCVVGLCRGPSRPGGGCHRMFDEGELDLLAIVTARWPAERPQFVHMLEHLAPVEAIERLAGDRTQWSPPGPTTRKEPPS